MGGIGMDRGDTNSAVMMVIYPARTGLCPVRDSRIGPQNMEFQWDSHSS
jgi:hypothetical protein